MSQSINNLKEYFYNREELSIPTIADYFGFNNYNDDENFGILLGIYSGLIKYKGIDLKLIHNCLLSKRLEELIHKKYKYNQSGYYKKFIEKNIKFDYLTIDEPIDKEYHLEIFDDDHCVNCNNKGYITNNNCLEYVPNDCCVCFKMICKLCSKFDNEKMSNICLTCLNIKK